MDEEENQNIINIFKLDLVGESGVGKTCIINRYIKDIFLDEGSTSFASYSEKILNLEGCGEKCIKFHIWDTAGQEKYRSIGKLFYNGANAAVLVYDITNEKSFDEIKNFWYNEVKKHILKEASMFKFI